MTPKEWYRFPSGFAAVWPPEFSVPTELASATSKEA